MKNLIEILKKETHSLKIQYLELTEKYAKEELQRNLEKRNEYKTKSKKDFDNLNYYYQLQKFYYNKPSWYFTEEFIDRTIKSAEKHYENSIAKLADRIEKKELNIDKLKVETSHVGVNIDTVLTDGEKTVRAYTIIASGPIQRPHYRYLIK
ncbi:MAG: hypothetical protein ACOCV1_07955 [Bacillota bacterium]